MYQPIWVMKLRRRFRQKGYKLPGWKTAVALALAAILGLVGIGLFVSYRADRSALTNEWAAKVTSEPRRSPAAIRGLLNGLIESRDPNRVPSFLPESMVDNVACSAAVSQAVNFLVGGEPLLVTADAWRFAEANASALETVYDRLRTYPGDFAVEDGRIVERRGHDRRVWLSQIVGTVGQGSTLTANGIYIVGYHYRETQSDREILAANGTWNSHVLLLLGRRGGRWWGYHLYHDPERPTQNPFHIDNLGDELPEQFDVMYVWRVKGVDLGLEAGTERLVSVTRPYQDINRLVGWFNWTRSARIASFFDGAAIGLFGDREQYPVIVQTARDRFTAVESSNFSRPRHGQVLGLLNGVEIRRHVGNDVRGVYGLEHECVEFVNRYYATRLRHHNLARTGNADSYFYDPAPKGLVAFPNGGTTAPERNDILVFDPDGLGGDPGHVAIVYEVTQQRVCFAQQNTSSPSGCLPVRVQDGRWSIDPLANNRPCVGWSRRRLSDGASTNPDVLGLHARNLQRLRGRGR